MMEWMKATVENTYADNIANFWGIMWITSLEVIDSSVKILADVIDSAFAKMTREDLYVVKLFMKQQVDWYIFAAAIEKKNPELFKFFIDEVSPNDSTFLSSVSSAVTRSYEEEHR